MPLAKNIAQHAALTLAATAIQATPAVTLARIAFAATGRELKVKVAYSNPPGTDAGLAIGFVSRRSSILRALRNL